MNASYTIKKFLDCFWSYSTNIVCNYKNFSICSLFFWRSYSTPTNLNIKPKKIKSSAHGARFFCEECGTPIACVLEEDPENINITIASLDKPEEFEPKAKIYVDDMLDWLK